MMVGRSIGDHIFFYNSTLKKNNQMSDTKILLMVAMAAGYTDIPIYMLLNNCSKKCFNPFNITLIMVY